MQGVSFSICLLFFTSTLFFDHVNSQNFTSYINPKNGLPRGEWGPIDLCPAGTYAAQFEIKYHPWGSLDVLNTNGVKFYCHDSSWAFVTYVTSTEGSKGDWQGIRACPQGTYIIGYSLDVLEDQGTFGDDVGVSNMKVECEDGTLLDGLTPSTLNGESKIEPKDKETKPFRNLKYTLTEEDKKRFGINKHVNHGPHPRTFGALATCPTGQKMCGLSTRVEEGTVSDDAGVTDVEGFCCI